MKFLAKVACLGAMVIAGPAFAVSIGDAFPIETLAHIKEGSLKAQDLKNKVTIVNFWATWCDACKVELVEMEEKFSPLFGKDNFQVAFVSLDKDPTKATSWFSEKLKKPDQMMSYLYSDAKFELAETLELDTFPMTYVIGPDGKVAHIQKGFTPGEGSTEAMVSKATTFLKQ